MIRTACFWLLVSSAILVGCGDESGSSKAPSQPATPLAPPPEGSGFQVSMTASVPPGTEAWLCDVFPAPNLEMANVHRVELRQTPGMHHLTVSALSLLGGGGIPYGRYDCKDLFGDSSVMENQVMLFGNQGVAEDELVLPDGIAATIPAGLDFLQELHFVNASPEPVDIFSYVNAWTIPPEEVVAGIYGGTVRDENIAIPPNATHTEWSRCIMNEDVDMLFLASHTHGLGTQFTIAPFDGEHVGEVFYDNRDLHTPMIEQYTPPMTVKAGTGFEWKCTYDNTTSQPVGYGPSATDEMCNMAIVFTPLSLTAKCEVVETSDGVLWDGK